MREASSQPSFATLSRAVSPSLAAGIAALVMMVVAAATLPSYPGRAVPYLLFHAAAAALVAVTCFPPVSYGFATLTLFLILGFWVKTVAALLGLPVLIEPTGAFAHHPGQWDAALLVTAAGLVGLCSARVLWLLRSRTSAVPERPPAPSWYVRRRGAIWLATAVAIVASNVLNWAFSFYAVGVHPRLVLPLHLNIAMAWWLTVGSGIWLAFLLDLEHRRAPQTAFGRWLLIPMAEALLSTSVMLSRGFYVMKVLPYALVLVSRRMRHALSLSGGMLVALTLVAIVGFGLSLVFVSWLRLSIYPSTVLMDTPQVAEEAPRPPADVPGKPGGAEGPGVPVAGPRPPATVELRQPTDAEIHAVTHQLSRMVLGRWIGLEGVMAVVSSEWASWSLLRFAVTEDPNRGNSAIFQVMSNATYRPQSSFTFLTLPGVVAIFSYSGSALVTALGMGVIGLLVLGTEAAYRRLLNSEFVCAVVGVAMANALAQMNFPYLTVVFFVELWGTLVLLWLLAAVAARLSLGRSTYGRPPSAAVSES